MRALPTGIETGWVERQKKKKRKEDTQILIKSFICSFRIPLSPWQEQSGWTWFGNIIPYLNSPVPFLSRFPFDGVCSLIPRCSLFIFQRERSSVAVGMIRVVLFSRGVVSPISFPPGVCHPSQDPTVGKHLVAFPGNCQLLPISRTRVVLDILLGRVQMCWSKGGLMLTMLRRWKKRKRKQKREGNVITVDVGSKNKFLFNFKRYTRRACLMLCWWVLCFTFRLLFLLLMLFLSKA